MKVRVVLYIAVMVLVSTITITHAGQFDIPAADKAKENAVAPEHSPGINEDWELTRYYIISEAPELKIQLGFVHEFPGAFSTILTKEQVEILESSGIRVEPVQLYRITGRPVCGDGVCQGKESRTCPEDCAGEPDSEPTRTCFPDSQIPWGINKVNGSSGGAGVIIAVLDSGVKTDHPDLIGSILDCRDTTKKGIKKGCADNNGHGTHVAGTIAANGGTEGIYGVAPEAQLMAVKVCGGAFCWGDDIAEGIYYAADREADIISLSLGGDLPDPLVLQAIDYSLEKGGLVVAAAGNDGPGIGSIDYPAAYWRVIAVGAININESVPSFSSRGINDGDYIIEEREIEFGAPGVSVESTYKNGCYAYMSGTSMATPHVSGLAAKLWQGNAADTRSFLQNIVKDIWVSGDDTATGLGLPIAP